MDMAAMAARLEQADRELAALRSEKERLERENAKLRSLLRSGRSEGMSTKLKDALRE